MSARRLVVSLAVSSFLVLAACTSTAPPPAASGPSPVKVVVTANNDVQRWVRTAKLVEVTEQALNQYAGDAAPATLTIRFTGLAQGGRLDWRTLTPPSSGRAVPIVSTTPWTEPSRPLASEGRSAGGVPSTLSQTMVKGTYTITDERGIVLDQGPILISPDTGDGYGYFNYHLGEQRDSARYLAKRVAKLSRKQQG